jgi:malonyl-CoA decarboxylase
VESAREGLSAAAPLLQISPRLEELLAHPDWFRREEVTALLHEPLERLCARYLHQSGRDGVLLDPVERFHLGNGARIERISWLGDTSPKGLRQSCGFMANYLYKLDDIEKNQELYDSEGKIPASGGVRSLLRDPEGEGGRRSRLNRLLRISLFP